MAVRQLEGDPETERSPGARRCFIAAHPKTNLDTIRAILAERGIEATASYERPWIGARPIDTVMALIDQADLVIGVLDDPAGSTDLGFELGYAFAHDKKILTLLPRNSRTVPPDLAWTHHIRANPTETEGITFHLDMLLDAPKPQRHPHIPMSPETHPIGDAADLLLERLATAQAQANLIAVEQILTDTLTVGGVSRITTVDKKDLLTPGPDMGVWCNDLESSVGNPLLISVKLGLDNWRAAGKARREIESYLPLRSVEWGLLIYTDSASRRLGEFESVPPVLLFEASSLIERLRTESFGAVVGELHIASLLGG